MPEGFPVEPGPSIMEMLLSELCKETGKIIKRQSDGKKITKNVGRAEGLAWALALMRNPYQVTEESLDAIREEVMDRVEQQSTSSTASE